MAGAYTLNAYQVNFSSVLTIKDENVVKMFKSLEKSGLRKFLKSPAIIYNHTLLDFYAKAAVEDGKIVYTQGDASITIDAALLGSTFLLPFSGNFECFVITKKEMSTALTSFSASREELSPSCFKKLLKIEYQILADIVAKALLVKAGTFDKLTKVKEKVQVMMAITYEKKMDWSRFLFRIMKDMVVRRGSGFAIQISKLLKDAGFPRTAEEDGSSVTMTDADSVLALRPKPTVGDFLAVKKKIGESQAEAQELQKKVKRNRVVILTDSEKTVSEESAAPTKSRKTIGLKIVQKIVLLILLIIIYSNI